MAAAGCATAAAPGAARAGRSPGRSRRAWRRSAPRRRRRAPTRRACPRPRASRRHARGPARRAAAPSCPSSGFGVTPAVHTIVSVSIRRPPDSITPPASADSSDVPVRISTPRLRERAGGEAREPLGRLAEDPRRAVDEHPAGLDAGQARVAAQRAGGQLLQLGQRLDAREARAGEHEREPALGAVRRGVGELDLAQHVVAQTDRVAHVLERERVLAQAGRGRHAADGAEREHEVGVADAEAPGVGLHDHAPLLVVELDGRAEQQVRVRAHAADRDQDVTRLDRAGRGLGEQRRVEHEVGRVDDRGARTPEAPGDVAAGEAAAEDEGAAAGDAGPDVGVEVHARRSYGRGANVESVKSPNSPRRGWARRVPQARRAAAGRAACAT